ncbi:MAG: hypothetical protein ACI92S_004867, partial [Planctomycetaceae bacterium]
RSRTSSLTIGGSDFRETGRGCEFFVGCDQRSGSNGWCADAGGFHLTTA